MSATVAADRAFPVAVAELGLGRMKSVKLAPKEGWETFCRSKEVIDHVFALSQNRGWHYMSFTTDTMIAESPGGGTIYLGLKGEVVVDAVISEPLVTDVDFEAASARLIREFDLTEAE